MPGARGAHRISKSPHILDVRLPSPKPTRVANHPVPTIAHVARAPAEPLVTLAHWGRSCRSSTACACDVPMPCSRTAQIASAALACRALPPFLRRPRTSRSTTTTTACARGSRSNRWQNHARTRSTPGARRSSTTTTLSTPPPPHLAQVTSRPRCAILPHRRQERQRSRFPPPTLGPRRRLPWSFGVTTWSRLASCH